MSRAVLRSWAASCITVSWRNTASSNTVESNTRAVRAASTPVSATTSRTASKIRSGRPEARSRFRQYTSTVGSNPSSVSDRPAATFQAMLVRSSRNASRSDKPPQRLQHHHRGDHLTRDRRATPPGGEQIGEQRLGEQPAAVLGQEPLHRPRQPPGGRTARRRPTAPGPVRSIPAPHQSFRSRPKTRAPSHRIVQQRPRTGIRRTTRSHSEPRATPVPNPSAPNRPCPNPSTTVTASRVALDVTVGDTWFSNWERIERPRREAGRRASELAVEADQG